MERLSEETIIKLRKLGLQEIREITIVGNRCMALFFNNEINFIITIEDSPKIPGCKRLMAAFDRGEFCYLGDLVRIFGFGVDYLGHVHIKTEENLILFIEILINKIKKWKEEHKDEDSEEKANNTISEVEYQALTDEEKSHFYTKEEIKYIFDNTLYLHEILELYSDYKNSGCKILSSIITTTNIFMGRYYSVDRLEHDINSEQYPSIIIPRKNIYTEEEIINELKKLPENLYLELFELIIIYHKILPSKWIDTILKIKKSPEELKKFVNKYPYLLSDSASYGFEKLINIFIDAGVDMSLGEYPDTKDSAMHWAASRGHEKIVKTLLDIGRPVNDVTAWVGANSGNTELVKLLIAAGADYTTGYAGTSLINAVETGNVEMVEILLEAGSDPTIKGYQLLNRAFRKGKRKANANFRRIYKLLEFHSKKRILKEYGIDVPDIKEIESQSEPKNSFKKS